MQVPLSTVASFVDKVSPLTINHQGVFPAVTLSFNLAPGAALSEAVEQIEGPPRAQRAAVRAGGFPGHGADLPGSLPRRRT